MWIMALSLAIYGIKGGAFTLFGGGSNKVWGHPSSMIADNNQLAGGFLVCLPLMNYLRTGISARRDSRRSCLTMGLTLFAVVGSYSQAHCLHC